MSLALPCKYRKRAINVVIFKWNDSDREDIIMVMALTISARAPGPPSQLLVIISPEVSYYAPLN